MRKFQLFLALVLVAIVAGNILFWNITYTNSVQSNYSLGYQQGEASGFQQGNQSGYSTGYSRGYESGDASGFSSGNTTGYQTGYTNGYSNGSSAGYLQGVKDGAGTGYNIRDPSYQEMLNFIASDKTDEHTYSENDYNCYDFTNDVCNNAFNAGIRCGSVYIEFAESAHSIVCFETTDQGLKFVEPQDDIIMTLTTGQKYFDRTLYEVDFDDTIVRYKVIW